MEEGELSYVLAEPGSGNQTTVQVGVRRFLHALLTVALYQGAGIKKSRPVVQQDVDRFVHTV